MAFWGGVQLRSARLQDCIDYADLWSALQESGEVAVEESDFLTLVQIVRFAHVARLRDIIS